MIEDIQYQSLPDTTRVWVYQSNQPLGSEKVPKTKEQIKAFAQQWISHNRQLRAYGDLLHDRFLVLMVDESQAGASGCSIDSSVRFVKALQAQEQVDFFDRMRFSYLDGDQVKTVSHLEFSDLYKKGAVNDDTIVFDTLVKDKAGFETGFQKKLSDSWHKRMV